MSEIDKMPRIEGDNLDRIKSIFPFFPVNGPMPEDTAVPGSFGSLTRKQSIGNGQADSNSG